MNRIMCSGCGHRMKAHRSKRPRYKDQLDLKGAIRGEYRISPKQCRHCGRVSYIEELHMEGEPGWVNPELVSEHAYNAMNETANVSDMGALVSEYSLRISRGADKYDWRGAA